MELSTPIERLDGVGPRYRQKLSTLGIKTVGELLFHFPHRYEDFSSVIPLSGVSPGNKCTVQGKVIDSSKGTTSQKRVSFAQIIIQDKSSAIKAIWFNQPYLSETLKKGDVILLSGEVSYSRDGLQFINPFYEKVSSTSSHRSSIIPVYPETEGLSSKWIRSILKSLIQNNRLLIKETLPEEIIKEKKLLSINRALRQIHFPFSTSEAKEAQRRFSFERILLIQLLMLKKRASLEKNKGVSVPMDIDSVRKLISMLPFNLTDAQKKCSWQILRDMERSIPMNRLLEGDVGSGKTIVATIAALVSIKAGYQVALMAPTEILSRQHFDEISKLIWKFKVDVGMLTGKKDCFRSQKLKGDTVEISREKLLLKALEGKVDLLIGTHALIQDKVKFKKLALVILDEQHRFGVDQRAKLCLKKESAIPHLLSMTATPIPRTLALTIYGDLSLSLLDEMPKERKKIITRLVSPSKRKDAYRFIEKEINSGRQAFFICPRIEEKNSENPSVWSDVKAVEKEKERLAKDIFPNLKIGMLHGKMKSSEKEQVMRDFKRKKLNILVSTSVVEVGIDIKNASVIVIEGAEMFGLAQLHQFRGRVGRGKAQSYCFLFARSPKEKTRKRLKALIDSENGFELAEKDLEIRGPGDFMGKRQWGVPDFTMEALNNRPLVEDAREEAKKIIISDTDLKKHPLLLKRVLSLEKKIHLE